MGENLMSLFNRTGGGYLKYGAGTTMLRSWSNPYVTDGLVAMLDGEWNISGGSHGDEVRDIVGSHTIVNGRQYSIGSNYWGDGSPSTSSMMDIAFNDDFSNGITVELCRDILNTSNSSYAEISIYNGSTLLTQEVSSGYPISSAPWINIGTGYSFLTRSGQYEFTTISFSCQTSPFGVYADGLLKLNKSIDFRSCNLIKLGYSGMNCYSLRVYNRALSAQEIAANFAVDQARFGI